MSLCMCTMKSCPASFIAGLGTTPCCLLPSVHGNRDRQYFIKGCASMFAVGFCLFYLPLTIVCAAADHARWKLWTDRGQCWSEGAIMPGMGLGMMAGGVMGFALAGLVVVACQALLQNLFRPRKRESSEDGHSLVKIQDQKEQKQHVCIV